MRSEGLFLNDENDSKKHFHLFLSDDEMSVVLKVFPSPVSDGKILDFESPPMTKRDLVGEILRTMSDNGIIFGIDSAAICGAVEKADGIPVIVARGVQPEKGKDGYIEWLVPLEPVPVDYDDEEKVNFWERWHLPVVKEGEDIAVLHPPLPGKEGITVNGHVVEPPPVKKAPYVLKEDEVALRDDGKTIYALKTGRPVIRDYNNEIGISSIYFHDGDVDLNSGNLRFDGDIVINGNVMEGMEVTASGNIEIKGNVYFSRIDAGRNLIVFGSIVNCDITAGKYLIYNNYKSLVDLLESDCRRLYENIQYINSCTTINKAIIMHKVKEIYKALSKIKSTLEKIKRMINGAGNGRKDEIEMLTSRVQRFLENSISTMIQSSNEIRNIIAMIMAVKKLLSTQSSETFYIAADWVQGGRLFSTGDIFVKSFRGCYNANLEACKNISVFGIVRNSQLTAGKKITIGEAGSPLSGEEVYIIGSQNSIVKVKKAHPGVVLVLGNQRYHVDNKKDYFKLSIDNKTGQIKEGSF